LLLAATAIVAAAVVADPLSSVANWVVAPIALASHSVVYVWIAVIIDASEVAPAVETERVKVPPA